MSRFTKFLSRMFGRSKHSANSRSGENSPTLQSRFDAAQTGSENYRHWAAADDLSANAAASPDVRRTIRRRARYERDNNGPLNGLLKQIATDTVGTGPRLQLGLGEEHEESAKLVEQSFKSWCRAVGLADKLRVLVETRPVDGEAFTLFVDNPELPSPVKLDLKLIEAEQVADPTATGFDPRNVDGVVLDASGNPTEYRILRQHPGDSGATWGAEYERVPARYVCHWFRPARPGQARGVSELAPSLAIGSQSRRYSLAVLGSAEFAASVAGVLETEAPPPGEGEPVAAWKEVEFNRNALLTLPSGVKAKTFDQVEAIIGHADYLDYLRAEMGRPLQAPLNVAIGSSAKFNYSSARCDLLPYQRSRWCERDMLRHRVLDRVFLAWVREAALVGLIPDGLPAINLWVWDFHWDGFGHVDPVKEATAVQLRLTMGLTTLSEECAADGRDWREVVDQRAREMEYMRRKGLTLPVAPTSAPVPTDPTADPSQDLVEEPADV